MRSPRFAPAGLLLVVKGVPDVRVAIDGGGGARVGRRLDAWLVTDLQAELIAEIRRRAGALRIVPDTMPFRRGALDIVPRRVAHTSHPTFAFEIRWRRQRVVWAPEFWHLPRWVAGADLLFADAAGWSRPIRFAGGVGGHAAALHVAARARALGVRRLVFAHIGRPTIRALDGGERPAFGEMGRDGESFLLEPAR
jgi:hypothetical protein